MKKIVVLLIISVLVPVGALTWALIYSNDGLSVTEYNISSGRIVGLNIVHLSDLHNKEFGSGNGELLETVFGLKPDLIVLTGDIVDERTSDPMPVAQLLNELNQIAPTVYIFGNHEARCPVLGELLDRLTGVTVLRDELITMELSGQRVSLLGLYEWTEGRGEMLRRLEQSDGYRIILSHYPEDFCITEQYYKYCDLMLAGHAHGGQIRLPIIDKALYAPGEGLFPEYADGLHYKDGAALAVSRGLGAGTVPFRLFNRPEVVLVRVNGPGD